MSEELIDAITKLGIEDLPIDYFNDLNVSLDETLVLDLGDLGDNENE